MPEYDNMFYWPYTDKDSLGHNLTAYFTLLDPATKRDFCSDTNVIPPSPHNAFANVSWEDTCSNGIRDISANAHISIISPPNVVLTSVDISSPYSAHHHSVWVRGQSSRHDLFERPAWVVWIPACWFCWCQNRLSVISWYTCRFLPLSPDGALLLLQNQHHWL